MTKMQIIVLFLFCKRIRTGHRQFDGKIERQPYPAFPASRIQADQKSRTIFNKNCKASEKLTSFLQVVNLNKFLVQCIVNRMFVSILQVNGRFEITILRLTSS